MPATTSASKGAVLLSGSTSWTRRHGRAAALRSAPRLRRRRRRAAPSAAPKSRHSEPVLWSVSRSQCKCRDEGRKWPIFTMASIKLKPGSPVLQPPGFKPLRPRHHESRKSHSLPITHRKALSLPFNIPHSKSVHGPRFSSPTSSSVSFAAAKAPAQIVSTVVLW